MSLRRVPAGAERERYVPLLLLADESEQQVGSYLNHGELYDCCCDHRLVGVVLAVQHDPDAVELRAVAVESASQGQGLGRRMLVAVLDDLRARGVRRAIVGTASSAIGPFAFYQKAGFRPLRIERDYFSAALGYPPGLQEYGIAVRDMIWMDRSL